MPCLAADGNWLKFEPEPKCPQTRRQRPGRPHIRIRDQIRFCQPKPQGFFVIYQIIYSSESSTPMQLDDLEDILVHARKKNVVRGITGALVYSDGVFLQILEGDRANVQQLMVKILQDLRHGTVTVLQEGEIACAVFGRWQMAYVSATPEQVAAWAGIGVAAEGHEMVSSSGQDPHRAAQFAQSILALLSPDNEARTKVD
jgi:hypothetical protein